jgi:dTDP-4-dehydrorhamnose reductase
VSLSQAVVVGSGGQVARALRKRLDAGGSQVLLTSSSGRDGALPLNLAEAASIRDCFNRIGERFRAGPVEIFLAGAMTHVDRCEQERDLCRAVNADGPRIVAEECARRDWKLTYFSTEYVFGEAEYAGGAIGPFSETDPPAPTSWYGECKLLAEQAVQKIFGADGALILRTTMVFSWDPEGMNFLMQYLRHLESRRQGGMNVFSVPEDQVSTPTYAPALADGCCLLREQGHGGIVNLVGRDLLSRKELVERVIQEFGFDREQSLAGFRFLKTAELAQKAKRPLTAGLTHQKSEKLGVKVWSLAEAFAEVKKLRQAR